MNKTESIKSRYIYAVVRHLPLEKQGEVERELDGIITEMLNARGIEVPTEGDLKKVIAELGTPQDLALKYAGEARTALISGMYYLMYKRVLIIALPILMTVMAVVTLVGLFTWNTPIHLGYAIGDFLGGVLRSGISGFAVITIIFAALDYFKVNIMGDDIIESLPELPEGKRISRGGAIASIIFLIVGAALFLGVSQLIGGTFYRGDWVSLFDPDAVRALWLPIVIGAAAGICSELYNLGVGKYTWGVAGVTVIASAIMGVCAFLVFGSMDVINPEFFTAVASHTGDTNLLGVLDTIEENWRVGAMLIIGAILIWECAEAIYYAWRRGQVG